LVFRWQTALFAGYMGGHWDSIQKSQLSGSMSMRSLMAARMRCLQPEVTLGRLNGHVTQEELNLL